MKRYKYLVLGLSVLWWLSTFGCTAKVAELDMADQALKFARESQAPKYAPNEYKEAENTITQGHWRANEFNGEEEARIMAILGINRANYARALSLEKQQEERQNLLKAQITATQKDLDDARALLDKIKQELESRKSSTPAINGVQ